MHVGLVNECMRSPGCGGDQTSLVNDQYSKTLLYFLFLILIRCFALNLTMGITPIGVILGA